MGLPASERVFHAIKKYDFKDENEIRFVIYKSEEQKGLKIPFNFKKCIKKIVLNPNSDPKQKEAVIALAKKYSYSNIVEE